MNQAAAQPASFSVPDRATFLITEIGYRVFLRARLIHENLIESLLILSNHEVC